MASRLAQAVSGTRPVWNSSWVCLPDSIEKHEKVAPAPTVGGRSMIMAAPYLGRLDDTSGLFSRGCTSESVRLVVTTGEPWRSPW